MTESVVVRDQDLEGFSDEQRAEIVKYGFTVADIETMVTVGILPEKTPPPVARYFSTVARHTGLSPLRKELHLVPRKTKKGMRYTVQTGIDGYRTMAHRTKQLAGMDEAVFGEMFEGHPEFARVTVYRMIEGQRCAYTATAYWDEYCPRKGGDEEGDNGFMWRKMPRNQLAKCAEALALRKAFSAELGDVYVNEEMDQRREVEDIGHADETQAVLDDSVILGNFRERIKNIVKVTALDVILDAITLSVKNGHLRPENATILQAEVEEKRKSHLLLGETKKTEGLAPVKAQRRKKATMGPVADGDVPLTGAVKEPAPAPAPVNPQDAVERKLDRQRDHFTQLIKKTSTATGLKSFSLVIRKCLSEGDLRAPDAETLQAAIDTRLKEFVA